jgi:dolichol-phosphate mannosyltransferase
MGRTDGRPTWVILPTYNEVDNLATMIGAVRTVLERCRPDAYRILVVDDGSPDGTGRLADRLAAAHAEVEVLHRTRKEGLGRAYVAGFMHALERGAAQVVEMDCDFSHDPERLPALLRAVDDGADVALGSRYVPGGRVEDWGPLRRIISRGGCWYAGRVLGAPVRDLTGGFKCFDAAALRGLEPRTVMAQGYMFQVEMTYRALQRGLRVVEVPITFRDREVGTSKMSPRIALEAAWLVPRLRWRGGRGRLFDAVGAPASSPAA